MRLHAVKLRDIQCLQVQELKEPAVAKKTVPKVVKKRGLVSMLLQTAQVTIH